MHIKGLILGAAIAFMPSVVLADAKVPTGTFTIDTAHSKVGFEIPHLVISSVEGRFTKFTGEVVLDNNFNKSTTKLNTEIASISTDNDKRDEHLRSADFFDAKKFPEMKFVSTKVEGTPGNFKLTGNLTIKDVTKPVTFESKYLGSVNDPFGLQRLAFKASTKINRQDFGLKWSKVVEAGPVVGDEVTVLLNFEATRPLPKS